VTQAVALRAGSVLAQARRGAQGRPGHAAGRLPGSVGLHHLRRLLVAGQGLTWNHQPAGSDLAHFSFPHLSPELAAATRVSLARLRRRPAAASRCVPDPDLS
jgi:hypothetical protein